MPAAYHGTPHTFKAEEGAPLGRFKSSQIGTGEGAQAYGHGLYFAGKTDVADFYRQTLTQDQMFKDLDLKVTLNMRNFINMFRKNKNDVDFMRKHANRIKDDVSEQDFSELTRYINHVEKNGHPKETGSLYKVELAPKENEYLLWDEPVPDRFIDKIVEKSVDEGLVPDRETAIEGIQSQDADRQGYILYRELSDQVGGDKAASQFLKEAGIPGIKYLDGDSRAKGKGDYNYVIFDEADVTITEKLFMPASEAGASKGKLAEAAKLWNEKGTDSPYFKKWFGKSKVVDENGDPLVVYHGTDRQFTSFDPKQIGSQFDGYDKIGFFFTTDKFQAEGFAHGFMAAEGLEPKNPKGRVLEAYLNIEKPLTGDIVEKITKDPIDKDIYGGFYYEKHKAVIEDLMSSGKYDGLNIGDLFVATKPEQIKSATGNRGTFDAGEGNILFMPASEAKSKLKELEASAKKDPLDNPSRNHRIQASLLEGIINESQGGGELDIRVGKHEGGEGSTYIEYISDDGDSFKIRATDHDRQLSSITNHRRPDFTLASDKKNVSESSGDWIDAIVKLENETDFRIPKRLEGRIKSIITRREEIQKLKQEIATQESLQREQESKAIEDAKLKALATPEGKALSDEKRAIRLELQNSSGTGKYTRNQRQSMYKKVRKLEKQLVALGRGEVNFMPSDPKAPKRQPVNRVQQQARSMPANRFMAPASMAKGELSERFR